MHVWWHAWKTLYENITLTLTLHILEVWRLFPLFTQPLHRKSKIARKAEKHYLTSFTQNPTNTQLVSETITADIPATQLNKKQTKAASVLTLHQITILLQCLVSFSFLFLLSQVVKNIWKVAFSLEREKNTGLIINRYQTQGPTCLQAVDGKRTWNNL